MSGHEMMPEEEGTGPQGPSSSGPWPPAAEGEGQALGDWLAGAAMSEAVGEAEARMVTDAAGELAEAKRQRDEYLDSWRRAQADFENYRRRVERQQREMAEHASTALVTKLLPVLDTADLALAHGAGEEVKQVGGYLFDVLAKEGLQRIVPEGQAFDPQRHDAVAHEEAEGEGAPQVPEVSEVLRAGYEWKGRVLRPAMVKVRG
jgi:molecular chaperone GrpE